MAGGNNVARMSPRQRMINLMYIVLTAMLALNVSSDVLNGFSQVHDGLLRTHENISARNSLQFEYLAELYEQNPVKAGPWYEQGQRLHNASDSICGLIESLKIEIARKADGADADYHNLINLDDLEAASAIMLNPATRRGEALRKNIENYRSLVASMIPDSAKSKAVIDMLSTSVKPMAGTVGPVSWEERNFDNMPAVASVTMLTKIQTDIRQAESEAMTALINNVDIGDIRVNELSAYVIPNSNMIMRGGKYSAHIVLAAIDTTQRPEIFVNGQRINSDGLYEFVAGSVGNHQYSGYIRVPRPDGTVDQRPFSAVSYPHRTMPTKREV